MQSVEIVIQIIAMMHFLEANLISIQISLPRVPADSVDDKSALVHVLTWYQTGDKPLPDSMLAKMSGHYELIPLP